MDFCVITYILSTILSAAASAVIGLYVLIQDKRSFIHRVFCGGMLLLAIEAALTGLLFQSRVQSDALILATARSVVTGLLPSLWLAFSVCYAQADYHTSLHRWKWFILSLLAVPLILTLPFGNFLFTSIRYTRLTSDWVLFLGPSGVAFHIALLLGMVAILVNLERTLRASFGSMRWRVKFMLLGVGSIFAARVYTTSQTLLFSSIRLDVEIVNSAALLVASILVLISLKRGSLSSFDLYLSQSTLHKSFTLLIIGFYLLVLGAWVKLVQYLGGEQAPIINAFLIFVAFLVLGVILLSDRLHLRIKRYISRNFHRPRYDYRKIWMDFAGRTTTLLEEGDLSSIIGAISRNLDMLVVTVWVLDESSERMKLAGSSLPGDKAGSAIWLKPEYLEGFLELASAEALIDFKGSKPDWAENFQHDNEKPLAAGQARYAVPLVAAGQLLGLITLDGRVNNLPLELDDIDLLKAISDHLASSLLNAKLSKQLRKARELELFQRASTFYVHDLKNLAHKLSLTMQNFDIHFDNPDFRSDAKKMISESVEKINTMCQSLSQMKGKPALHTVDTDLNSLISSTVKAFEGCIRTPVTLNLQPMGSVPIDPDGIRTVLTNLVLNASDAVGEKGEISISTSLQNSWVVMAVADNGHGMSKQFIEESLFQPFKSTKSKGLGIGLHQSKTIVEAHNGRIEVESTESVGSTFRVLLPVKSQFQQAHPRSRPRI